MFGVIQVEMSGEKGIWKLIIESVIRIAHHSRAYVFITTHLLFVERTEFRLVQRFDRVGVFKEDSQRFSGRNAAYIVLFPSVRERSSIGVLARRCFPSKPEILTKAYDHLLANPRTTSYIILDLRPRIESELLRVRHSFRLDAPLVGYLPAAEAAKHGRKVGATSRPSQYAKSTTKS